MSTPEHPEAPKSTEPLLVTVSEAASLLSISERKLGELTRTRAVPSKRIGRVVRYSPQELAHWIELGCPTAPGSWDLRGAA